MASAGNGSTGTPASASTPAHVGTSITDNMWNQEGFEAYSFTYTAGIDLSDNTGEPAAEFTMPPSTTELPRDVQFTMPPSTTELPRDVAPRTRGKGKTRAVPIRSSNFKVAEDEVLCSAFLNVCKDPIVGVNQSQGAYWARITRFYEENKRTPNDRSRSALQHRWADIQRDTSRFCGFYDEIERKHQSGKNEDDKVKDALQMFEEIVGSPFKFLHCWFILRHEMKWNAHLATLHGRREAEATEAGEGDAELMAPPRMERPMGRDRAKKQRSNSQSSSLSACLEVL